MPPKRHFLERGRPPKRAPGAGRRGPMPVSGPRVRWSGLEPLHDAAGRERKRFYKLETLANATEYFIRQRDDFVVPSVHDVLGPAPVAALLFELFLETASKLFFRVRATNANGRQASLAFVAAKNDTPYGARLAAERANLGWLHQRLAQQGVRAPQCILNTLRGGSIYLPDRHGRKGHGREIYAYMAQWPAGFHELGIGKNGCFFVQGLPPQPVTADQTDQIRARMASIVAATYHPQRRDCVDMPVIAEADFLATRPQQGAIRLKLVTCRGILKHMTPARVLHRMAGVCYTWRGRRFPLLPNNPAHLLDELSAVLGADTARHWLTTYRDALVSGRLPEQPTLTVDALATLNM